MELNYDNGYILLIYFCYCIHSKCSQTWFCSINNLGIKLRIKFKLLLWVSLKILMTVLLQAEFHRENKKQTKNQPTTILPYLSLTKINQIHHIISLQMAP